jgi:mono/diheme cytochrome c family protein
MGRQSARVTFRLLAIVALTVLGGVLQARVEAGQEPASRSVWDGVYTAEQARRGEEVYRASCITCHGESLAGGGPATPLTGPVFSANWNGVSLGDMLERVRNTMPLDKPGTLSRQQFVDVLAFVFSVNKFPAGQTELSRQTEMLNQIKFLSVRP